MQPLQNCIGPTIRIGREILCLPYAGFLIVLIPKLYMENCKSLRILSEYIFWITLHCFYVKIVVARTEEPWFKVAWND